MNEIIIKVNSSIEVDTNSLSQEFIRVIMDDLTIDNPDYSRAASRRSTSK